MAAKRKWSWPVGIVELPARTQRQVLGNVTELRYIDSLFGHSSSERPRTMPMATSRPPAENAENSHNSSRIEASLRASHPAEEEAAKPLNSQFSQIKPFDMWYRDQAVPKD